MLNLIDKNVAYLLVNPYQETLSEDDNFLALNRTQSLLYNREYSLISLVGNCHGKWNKAYLAYNNKDNQTLREDALFVLKMTNQKDIVIKYEEDNHLKLMSEDGSESILSLQNYLENSDNSKIYIYNGYYFSLVPEISYFMIESKSQIKPGMKLEFFNNDKWNEKVVYDVDKEFENMYKLLIKYKKLRAIAL